MPRLRIWFLSFSSLLMILAGWQVGLTYSQDENLEYAGTRECRSCHRSLANDQEESVHSRTLIDVAEADKDVQPIIADFESGEDIRTIQFPDEDDPRPFTEDDVFFTLGVGRHYQAYVYETEKNLYRVFPAQWSVADEAWVPLTLADDWSDPAYDFNSQCASCHTTNFDDNKLEWEENGVQCEACHGPGLNHVEIADDAGSSISDDEYKELSGAINFALDPQVCGQCHSRGAQSETGHPFPVNYTPGKNLLDESVYTLPDLSDTDFWYTTGHAKLPNMQFNEWLQSAHSTSLDAAQESDRFEASCLTCHSVAQKRIDYLINEDWVDEDDFDKLSVLDNHSFGISCVSCHNPHEVDSDNFLRDEAYPLCISCHNNGEDNDGIHHPVQEIFEGIEVVAEIEPIVGLHFSADEGPDCVTCHMTVVSTKNGIRNSHTFHPVSPAGAADIDNLQDACTVCHTDIQNPVEMQNLIDSVQTNVTDRLKQARDKLDDTSPAWISLALDAVEGDGSRGIHNYSYVNSILSSVESDLGIVSGTVTNNEIADQITAVIPDIETEPLPTSSLSQAVDPDISGLSAPSLVLLAIAALIILTAAYSFFMRKGEQDE